MAASAKRRRRSESTSRKAPPLGNPLGSFANGGDAEAQMIGQGLRRCVEAALEWRADDARGEERLLDDSARLRSFLEGTAGDQEVVDLKPVLLQTLSAAALCQQQVHRAAARRLFCLHQTRPHATVAFGPNAIAPESPLPSNRRVLSRDPTARLDQLVQNMDKCHVSSRRTASPPRYAHPALCR